MQVKQSEVTKQDISMTWHTFSFSLSIISMKTTTFLFSFFFIYLSDSLGNYGKLTLKSSTLFVSRWQILPAKSIAPNFKSMHRMMEEGRLENVFNRCIMM